MDTGAVICNEGHGLFASHQHRLDLLQVPSEGHFVRGPYENFQWDWSRDIFYYWHGMAFFGVALGFIRCSARFA